MSFNRFGHAELQECLPAYLADELDTEEREAVAAHLTACAACRAELEELRQLVAALAMAPPRPIAGPSLADPVMARIFSRPPEVTLREHARDDALSVPMRGSALDPPAHSRMPVEQRHPSQSLVAAIIAMIAVVGFLAAVLASHRTPSGPANPIPSVGDWRAAYLGSDGRLHTVSATGERRTGPTLPGTDPLGLPMSSRAGISPDGRYLAYIQTNGPVTVADLASGRETTLDLMATELHWASDAPRFVSILSTVDGGIAHLSLTLTDVRTDQSHDVPLGPTLDHARVVRLVGWIDAQHVALAADQGGKGLTVSLMSLDLTTGGITPLSTLVEAPDVYLSPDGKLVFIAPNYWAPSARVVNTATGSTRELPNITATFAGRFKLFSNLNLAYGGNWAYQWAWRPGTHTIALSLSASSNPSEGGTQPETQEAGVWFIDPDHDQATTLNHDRYPLAWTPDGRTLFLSDIRAASMLTNTGESVGPHLYALSPGAPGGKSQLLAQDMVAFFGLVRTG